MSTFFSNTNQVGGDEKEPHYLFWVIWGSLGLMFLYVLYEMVKDCLRSLAPEVLPVSVSQAQAIANSRAGALTQTISNPEARGSEYLEIPDLEAQVSSVSRLT